MKTAKTVKKKAGQQQQERMTRKSEDSSRTERSTPKEEKQRLKEVSKNIKQCIRDNKRVKRQQVIQRILEDFKGVSNIPGIISAKKKVLITKIKNERGEIITLRKGIANVFAELYKRLYDDNEQGEYEREIRENGNESSIDVHINDTDEMTRIPEIAAGELQDAIIKLKKKGKSPDSDGIRAEDIKACDDETREMVRQIFNEIIKQNEFTPEAWKKVKIKVLQKKGDVEKCW